MPRGRRVDALRVNKDNSQAPRMRELRFYFILFILQG